MTEAMPPAMKLGMMPLGPLYSYPKRLISAANRTNTAISFLTISASKLIKIAVPKGVIKMAEATMGPVSFQLVSGNA